MPNTKVILMVNTETIATDKTYKYKDSVIFLDNRGGRPGKGDKFDSKIDYGKKITWVVRPFLDSGDDKFEDGKDTVEIYEVEHTYGDLLLKQRIYTPVSGSNKIVGEVEDEDKCPDGGMQWYKITFIANGIKYTIDPKMHT